MTIGCCDAFFCIHILLFILEEKIDFYHILFLKCKFNYLILCMDITYICPLETYKVTMTLLL